MPSQSFDALDGLSITGALTVGANVIVDTNTLVVDATTNRVGIGKVPEAGNILDVNGTINSTVRITSPVISIGTNGAHLVANTSGVFVPRITSNYSYQETVVDGGNGTSYIVDVANGPVHKFTPTADYSIDFANFNPGTGLTRSFTLIINNNGAEREATWPDVAEADKVYWAESVEPPSSAGIDIYTFYVVEGQIYGSLSVRNAGYAS